MKKLILLFFVLSTLMLQAQTSPVPNNGFENWSTFIYEYPTNYDVNVNNNDNCIVAGIFPLTKVTGYSGKYGVQLKTTDEVGLAFMLSNYNPGDDDPSQWHGGIPYSEKPSGIRGYFKYNYKSEDQGLMIIAFSKKGTNIGTYYVFFDKVQTSYTLFDSDFKPALEETPDSVVIAFASSMPEKPVAGSILVVDSVSFKGVKSQPDLMNGDFESWERVSIDAVDGWNAMNQDPQALKKTTDSYKGDYAVELITFMGEEDHQPHAQPAQIMTGYYPDNCGEKCYPMGGYPFKNSEDVLTFYYKYTPAGKDYANVGLYFKDSKGEYDGWYAGIMLDPATKYTYVEIPFNLSFTPDSVIIQVQSSDWNNISEANVGSDLKIDEMYFLSQKTGLKNTYKNEISLFPNPTTKGFYLPTDLNIRKIIISDLRGAKVMEVMDVANYVDISSLPQGIYIVQLQARDGIYNGKLIKK